MRKFTGMAAAVVLAAAAGAVQAKSYNLTMCGASPGGLWSLLGAATDAAMKGADGGSTVTYQTSGGGFANVMLLLQKKCEVAIIHDAEIKMANDGTDPFKSPINNLRLIAVLYNWAPMHFIVSKDFAEKHGLKSLEDVVAKKVPMKIAINKRGNVASNLAEAMLEAAGASAKDLESWGGKLVYAASSEQGDLMRDRRIDGMLNSLFVGHSSIRQLADGVELSLLTTSQPVIEKLSAGWGIESSMIKPGAYDWAPQGADTVTLSALLVTTADADNQTIYDITKALVENVDKIQGVHKSMGALTTKLMSGSKTAPYHPGAQGYYKEAGLQ